MAGRILTTNAARLAFLTLVATFMVYFHAAILSLSGTGQLSQEEQIVQLPIPVPQSPPADVKTEPIVATSPTPDLGISTTTLDFALNEAKLSIQDENIQFRPPKMHSKELLKYAPHNDKGPGQFAYATYLSTHNISIHDPYFLSAQQLVYRLLWNFNSRTNSYPVVVFVAPHVPAQLRQILLAQGAIVRELDLITWDPPPTQGETIIDPMQWKESFSKLNIWAQTDFSRIALLDLDAFPLQRLDSVFNGFVAPRQTCRPEQLPFADHLHQFEICEYVLAAAKVSEAFGDFFTAGVIVLEPNMYMHARLIREAQDTSNFDISMAEEGFFNYAFSPLGPFPPSYLGREWNGFHPQEYEKELLKVVHEKLWEPEGITEWTKSIFQDGWHEMLALYEIPHFELLRIQDGRVSRKDGGHG